MKEIIKNNGTTWFGYLSMPGPAAIAVMSEPVERRARPDDVRAPVGARAGSGSRSLAAAG